MRTNKDERYQDQNKNEAQRKLLKCRNIKKQSITTFSLELLFKRKYIWK